MNSALLAIDAGQSGVRAVLHADDAELDQFEQAGVQSSRPVLPQLRPMIDKAISRLPDSKLTVCAGVSALGSGETAAGWLATLPPQVHEVLLAHDSITSYLSVLGDRTGVVVAAGTGVVTLAVGSAGTARVDGWGHLVGDAGSGYWIGRAGLDLVLRAFDGRAEPTSLSQPVQAHFPDLTQMYLQLQHDPAQVSRIASFAKLVNEHAEAGDPACAAILDRAATELASSALAGAKRVGLSDEPQVTIGLVGMVFESPQVRAVFENTVSAQLEGARFERGAVRGLAGAKALASVPGTSPLAGAVHRASR